MFKTKKQSIFTAVLLSLAILLVFAGFGCKKKPTANETEPININFWSVFDDKEVYDPIITAYKTVKPNVNIVYKKLTYEEYEKAVVEGLAAGQGPDIWSIHNTWLPRHQSKLAAMPDSIMTSAMYNDTFVEVASSDFVVDDKIYGIPMSVDTLALYYNKDLLNTEGIVTAPEDWEAFKDAVKRLTKTDISDNILQSGAAIGTAKNINRAVDILYLLMLQNGTQMVNSQFTQATFNLPDQNDPKYFPGTAAMTFYTDFANSKKEIYSWNLNMPYSIDAFIEEKTAMMFNYSYQRSYLKIKAPNLNYGVSPAPQILGAQKAVNYANYWANVVSQASQNQNEAWDFVNFMSSKENDDAYCKKTDRPASRIDVLQTQLDDPNLKTFAKQALTAKSWYQTNPAETEVLFNNAIDAIVSQQTTSSDEINTLAQQVTSLMR
ncbi:MAG: extracellular solute-binding protein [Patescibacteria group bacterium]|nr:extracellular solute-binding protein [Patescibacteria group bacterium]